MIPGNAVKRKAEIRFSRHARRRMLLYGIPQSTIIMMLEEQGMLMGTHEIIRKIEGYKSPLKLIVAKEDDIITVVTCYPLKKGLPS
jgi:hypothetical protein